MRIVFAILDLLIALALWCVEGCFWLLRFLIGAYMFGRDIMHSRQVVRGNLIRCPSGHTFAIEGEELTFQCQTCGFVYSGRDASQLCCPNPDCPSPVTGHIECPVCGLSVANPYRWGRR
jgi:rubredoxin